MRENRFWNAPHWKVVCYGVTINRIEAEFLLKDMGIKSIPLKIHGARKIVDGIISNYQENEWVELSPHNQNWEIFEENEAMRIFFSYFGQMMTFQAKVLKRENYLRISYPKGIQKNLQRKYERVSAEEDIRLSFVIKENMVVLGFPKSEEYDPVDKPVLLEDLDFKNIPSIVGAFRKTASLYADNHRIHLFRNTLPGTLEESIISLYGKSLYFPVIGEELPKKEILGDAPIVSESLLFPEDPTAKLLPELEKGHLYAHVADYATRGITSLLYSPILYQQYVVGYVYLEGRRGKHETLSREALEYATQFSKILAYSLKLNGYFNETRKVPTDYQCGLIDISAAVLLFSHPSKSLRESLPLYTDFEVDLKLGNRKMTIGSRVMRRYQDSATNYYGIQFLSINPEDLRFLFDHVYGRPFTNEEERLWEGGMEPPRLDINKAEEN